MRRKLEQHNNVGKVKDFGTAAGGCTDLPANSSSLVCDNETYVKVMS